MINAKLPILLRTGTIHSDSFDYLHTHRGIYLRTLYLDKLRGTAGHLQGTGAKANSKATGLEESSV